ncbi:copper resistance system multicopper oxidase [Thalassospira sp. MCCC 1A02491]|uniref:copper resistance system multicopper oxidase n=1 Tax=Thalassospira sp. MCCC 1A02491 TaxID=1769751 RepID=UPI0007AD73A4|nr:copper resistance system multicopper oxidase [Thalassospira sp. MCCC 1A02491]KZB65071.1 copper oxidase [Thalassospira sp. MCCC 1A02491]
MKQRIVLRALLGALGTVMLSAPSFAATYDLTVDYVEIDTGTMKTHGIGYNGSSPGPTLRFKEGEEVVINVTNNLDEATSIHWHGLILPYQMDGVPGISFPGIEPGETFTYRIPVSQNGTYWFHSHSGFQEPDGAYGSIIIEPQKREPFKFDREYVVVLKDKHPHSGERILRNLKMMPDYYNRNQRSLGDFIMDARKNGLGATLSERADWGAMRMMPTDIEDVQGFVGLINGMSPEQNWTGLFHPEERVRLRFINASAMTYFDVRIPGLEMTVVQADGNNVQPVKVDEFRIAVAETYDVIVQPKDDKAYAIMAESMGRSGYGFGTLAPHEGMRAEMPELRKEAPLLTMADMGMNHGDIGHGDMGKGDMAGMDHGAAPSGSAAMGNSAMGNAAMDHGSAGAMPGMDHSGMAGMDHSNMAGMDHSAMAMGNRADPFYAAGSGLTPKAANGGKFLSYADLKAQKPLYADRPATREIELRLTGNMERYSWSINGVKYEDAEPIRLKYGERVRFKFVNETMMSHPMHLHGMWSILDTGQGKWNPVKHTININPGTTVYSETEVDEPGQWAFHCHLSYHMATGMFRKVVVEGGPAVATLKNGN